MVDPEKWEKRCKMEKWASLFLFYLFLSCMFFQNISCILHILNYVMVSSDSARTRSVSCSLSDVEVKDRSNLQLPDFFRTLWSREEGPCSWPILNENRQYLKEQMNFLWSHTLLLLCNAIICVSTCPYPLSTNNSGVIAIPRSSLIDSSRSAKYSRV